jgi:hypothetical protein
VSSLKILVGVAVFSLSSLLIVGQPSDQSAAARVFGPQWKQVARTAGMAFSGTVMSVTSHSEDAGSVPTINLTFKIDRAIAGVRTGQVLTIREWAGAWSRHRPLRTGDRVLLLLYPPSKLGLTSPVNGQSGQVALNPTGQRSLSHNISVRILERALRRAREE